VVHNLLTRAKSRTGDSLRAVRTKRDAILYPHADDPTEHWQRIVLNEAVDAFIESLDPKRLGAAEISGWVRKDKPWASYAALQYPEFDLCEPLADGHIGRYDIVICEQVLEHVVDPWGAARNLRLMSRPGGHVVVSTPFLVRIHEQAEIGMKDYWRWTPRGLALMLEKGGLVVDEVGSWGNRTCVVGNFGSWPGVRRWHSMRNEPDLPLQVWAFAHNPVAVVGSS
jgi:SAM-dependent methyltransferase